MGTFFIFAASYVTLEIPHRRRKILKCKEIELLEIKHSKAGGVGKENGLVSVAYYEKLGLARGVSAPFGLLADLGR